MIRRTVLDPDGAARLAALARRVFPDRAAPWRPEELADFAVQPKGIVLVAEAWAGYAMVRVAEGEAEILDLGVAPAARRQGLGRALVHRAMDEARAAGAPRAVLEVGAGNLAAQALYAAAGFVEVGRRPRYYRRPDGQREDALVLACDLAPPEAPV